jgi:selenide,water dikinase
MNSKNNYPLTQFSHGAGCGCKISPGVLSEILHTQEQLFFPDLLVGNEERDDAAAVDLGDGTAVISTTDFFMPIVDDPEDFGMIASVNAISDIYAMGGTPLLAIAILGWPINEIPSHVAQKVIQGGRMACKNAGIPLAGGHSIDSPEPIFGLAVTGRVNQDQLKRNGGAEEGDLLFLTKPLGVGILTTAQKQGKVNPQHLRMAVQSMKSLNKVGERLGELKSVHAMTDVTGFGLLGHLLEMCEASDLQARIDFKRVPILSPSVVDHYLAEGCVPGGTHRNWESYGKKVALAREEQKLLLCDPQTSGGLLVAVDPAGVNRFKEVCDQAGIGVEAFGRMETPGKEDPIRIRVQ